jgi:cob(I)alamin adenosyltransferase
MVKGLVIVLTGNGKGKTTSALGMALRASGQGLKVLILQFVKGGQFYGELKALQEVEGVEIRPLGMGMLLNSRYGLEIHRQKAMLALEEAREAIRSGMYQMIILDEILFTVQARLLAEEDILSLLREKPDNLHLVLTGRGATPAVIEAADTVTEMIDCKHQGPDLHGAVRGIEF